MLNAAEIRKKYISCLIEYGCLIPLLYFYSRLLVQLEETEKQFDNFWQKHSTKLNHWLKFRTFLLNFKQMQVICLI